MVEMVIVIVLIGIIAMTASLLIGQASQTYQKEDNYSAITNQGRLALEAMAREIRMIRSTTDITTSCNTSITPATVLNFTDNNGNLISYSFSGSTLLAGTNPLATNLASFGMTYYDKNYAATTICSAVWTVMISLTVAQGNESLSMRTTIHPRSF